MGPGFSLFIGGGSRSSSAVEHVLARSLRGRCRGMLGRVPGGSNARLPGIPPSSGRDAPVGDSGSAWSSSGAGAPANSRIQSAVSACTSSVTSSEKLRRTPRQRSAASLAVPSVGPRTSRTLSDAQSNWSRWRRRCTACAVATLRIQPEVTPK